MLPSARFATITAVCQQSKCQSSDSCRLNRFFFGGGGILSLGFHQDIFFQSLVIDCSSSSPVKLWRAQWDLVCCFCPVSFFFLISSWIFTIYHKCCAKIDVTRFTNTHVRIASATFVWTECVQEASVWWWRDVNTPVGRNERSPGFRSCNAKPRPAGWAQASCGPVDPCGRSSYRKSADEASGGCNYPKSAASELW